jgi:hypothetical protein
VLPKDGLCRDFGGPVTAWLLAKFPRFFTDLVNASGPRQTRPRDAFGPLEKGRSNVFCPRGEEAFQIGEKRK